MINIHSAREDIRATLANLLAILSVGEQTIQRTHNNQVSTGAAMLLDDKRDAPVSSVSDTSIDLMISVPAKKNYSISEENINNPVSR